MKRSIICVLPLFFFVVGIINAQELSKKKKYKDGITDQYFVLKDNKKIRHGESLKTIADILGNKYIIEYGQYKDDVKDGNWLFFYYVNPGNFLKSKGNYKNGKREGNWQDYYPGSASGAHLTTLLGLEKRTGVVQEKKEFFIEFDTTGQQMICSGKYLNDEKVGVWDYYSRSGYLFHQFDHTKGEMITNNLREKDNDFIAFLGGPERFYNYYITGQQEIKSEAPVTQTSEVIYQIDESGNYELIHAVGDENFKNQVEEILKSIPNDWVYLKESSTKKLQIIAKVLYNEKSFNRYQSSFDMKVVD